MQIWWNRHRILGGMGSNDGSRIVESPGWSADSGFLFDINCETSNSAADTSTTSEKEISEVDEDMPDLISDDDEMPELEDIPDYKELPGSDDFLDDQGISENEDMPGLEDISDYDDLPELISLDEDNLSPASLHPNVPSLKMTEIRFIGYPFP